MATTPEDLKLEASSPPKKNNNNKKQTKTKKESFFCVSSTRTIMKMDILIYTHFYFFSPNYVFVSVPL